MTDEIFSRSEANRLTEESREDRRRLHEQVRSQEAGIARLAGSVEGLRQQVPTDARERMVRLEEGISELKEERKARRVEAIALRGSSIAAVIALALWVATCSKEQWRTPAPRPSPPVSQVTR